MKRSLFCCALYALCCRPQRQYFLQRLFIAGLFINLNQTTKLMTEFMHSIQKLVGEIKLGKSFIEYLYCPSTLLNCIVLPFSPSPGHIIHGKVRVTIWRVRVMWVTIWRVRVMWVTTWYLNMNYDLGRRILGQCLLLLLRMCSTHLGMRLQT